MELDELINGIEPADEAYAAAARERWDTVAKPLGSLGLLEDAVVRIAAAQRTVHPHIGSRALAVFAADNGVVAEGVTQCGSGITALGVRNLCHGMASVSRMTAVAGCDVVPADVGLAHALPAEDAPGLLERAARRGTNDIAKGPACLRAEAETALLAGAEVAALLAGRGCDLLAAGELGIGNTTTSAAVACALLDIGPDEAAGRGSGLTDEGLDRKRAVVARALATNRPDPSDPLDVLAKVGGLDIASMCGFYLGAAHHRIPVVLDGLISCVAAVAAVRMAPDARNYLLASHRSAEPAAHMLLDELGLTPAIDAGLRLGEGTGAVAFMPLLDMALSVYEGAATFTQTGMDAYERLG